MCVKICGMRSERDIAIAVASGADALAFLVGLTHFSEDTLAPAEAARLMRLVPPFVSAVLVTHLVDPLAVMELARALGPDCIQVHGDMAVADIARLHDALPTVRLLKAIHVMPGADAGQVSPMAMAVAYAPFVAGLLLDSRTAERLGGTGHVHDWGVSGQVARGAARPVVLAGGLTPENVAAAVEAVAPFAVDVNSGVEDTHGDKDPQKCANFVARARAARVVVA